jgi:adenosylmethionine-8-amino-7-oxononanoate aminotransferase
MLVVDRADGCTLHLEDGRALVDGMASWWYARRRSTSLLCFICV